MTVKTFVRLVPLGVFFKIILGLHFNISEGVPVQADSTYTTLTNSDGHFLGIQNLRVAVSEGRIDTKEVRA